MAAEQQTQQDAPAPTRLPRTVLWAFSGGGLRGLNLHAASVLAATEAGLPSPTHLIGTSAGAIIAALMATGTWSAVALCQLLLGLTDDQVRSERWAWKLRLRWITHFLRHEPIADLLGSLLPAGWMGFRHPLRVVATDISRNRTVHIDGSFGVSPAQAVLASMSVFGVWPTVRLGHREYADGGTTENLPIWPRVGEERPFDEIVLFVATPPMRYEPRRDGVISRMMANVQSLATDQVDDVIRRTVDERAVGQTVRVVRPLVGLNRGALRFCHDLHQDAYLAARSQINDSLREAPCAP